MTSFSNTTFQDLKSVLLGVDRKVNKFCEQLDTIEHKFSNLVQEFQKSDELTFASDIHATLGFANTPKQYGDRMIELNKRLLKFVLQKGVEADNQVSLKIQAEVKKFRETVSELEGYYKTKIETAQEQQDEIQKLRRKDSMLTKRVEELEFENENWTKKSREQEETIKDLDTKLKTTEQRLKEISEENQKTKFLNSNFREKSVETEEIIVKLKREKRTYEEELMIFKRGSKQIMTAKESMEVSLRNVNMIFTEMKSTFWSYVMKYYKSLKAEFEAKMEEFQETQIKEYKKLLKMKQDQSDKLEIDASIGDKEAESFPPVKQTTKFRYDANERQFNFKGERIVELEKTPKFIENDSLAIAIQYLEKSIKALKERNKIIRIADKYVWHVIDEYINDPITEGTDDATKLKQAEYRAKAKGRDKLRTRSTPYIQDPERAPLVIKMSLFVKLAQHLQAKHLETTRHTNPMTTSPVHKPQTGVTTAIARVIGHITAQRDVGSNQPRPAVLQEQSDETAKYNLSPFISHEQDIEFECSLANSFRVDNLRRNLKFENSL
ncbi:unnamed protein product [Mytilus coruscus]|uniref:Uncharacterized protein n=1 Tax=Mytilus coruscus TaxID=42192 RepID=A0A6J8B5Y8_MYTCO|nr:unnamed protein product [Mytilus coruscus]